MKGISHIKRVVRILHRRIEPSAVILMYHRIADMSCDPFCLAVSPAHFERHLALIHASYYPMRLTELAAAIVRGAVPRRAVAITFDDGYADNYHQACTLLEAAEVPATVFVTTGKIGGSTEFWWDDLQRVLQGTTRTPECLRLSVQRHMYELPTSTMEERRLALWNLRDLVRRLPGTEIERIIEDLVKWAGIERSGRPEYRSMTTDELICLSQSDYLDVGAHTISHPTLSSIPGSEQKSEITGSRQRLQAILGKPITSFAFPYGNHDDFTDDTVASVRDAGFQLSVTTIQGSVEAGDDLFQLRRTQVNDWNLDEFRHNLEKAFIA